MVCYHCNQTEHYTWNYPQSYDIRTMSIEEKLELLPELLALANSSNGPHLEGQPTCEAGEISEPEAEPKEDFATSSG